MSPNPINIEDGLDTGASLRETGSREPSPSVLGPSGFDPARGAFGIPGVRRVPSTIVVGPRGPAIARGYTEIHGLRLYDDQVVVGRYGEYVIDKGGWGLAL